METHTALELLVLPIVRGVGGALAFFAVLAMIQEGFGQMVHHFRHPGRPVSEAVGPHRAARPRRSSANGLVTPASR